MDELVLEAHTETRDFGFKHRGIYCSLIISSHSQLYKRRHFVPKLQVFREYGGRIDYDISWGDEEKLNEALYIIDWAAETVELPDEVKTMLDALADRLAGVQS